MWTEGVLAALVLVFTIWSGVIFSTTISYWIVIVSAALLLIHAIRPHSEHCCSMKAKGGSRVKSKTKSRKKR